MIGGLLDRGVLPDLVIRAGIRQIIASRLREQGDGGDAARLERRRALLEMLGRSPIAVSPEAANAQHYEVPAAFFERVLGPHLKYSAAWWPPGVEALADAESRMLELTVHRARIGDGQRVLDLDAGGAR